MVFFESVRASKDQNHRAQSSFIPNWSYLPQFKNDNRQFKGKQKVNYDKRHGVKEHSTIPRVVVTTDHQKLDGKVVEQAESLRSYIVVTLSGNIRRNYSQLNVVPEQPTASDDMSDETTETQTEPRKIVTVTRSQTRK